MSLVTWYFHIFSVPILHLFCQENLAVSSCAQQHRSHLDPSADRFEIGCKVCLTEGTFRDISEGFQTKPDQSLPCPSHLPSWIAFMLTLRGNTSCNHRNPLCVYIYIFGMIYVAWVDGKSRFRVPWGTPLVPQNYRASYGTELGSLDAAHNSWAGPKKGDTTKMTLSMGT